MCSPLNCGTSSFPLDDDEYAIEELLSPKKPPKKIKDNGNPFTNRGLDKFNALLADLDRKKQQIYTQKGSQDISFIRFAYSSSGQWKPIVVKGKKATNRMPSNIDKGIVRNVDHHDLVKIASKHVDHQVVEEKNKNPEKESGSSSLKFVNKFEILSQPSCYVSLMFILIMLLLTVFGRTFSILCASIGWYLVPMIKDKSSSSSSNLNSGSSLKNDGSKMKKMYSVITKDSASHYNGAEDKSTAKHAHRKSW